MWKKIFQHKLLLSVLSGVFTFLAFPKFEIVPLLILFPFLFTLLILQCTSLKQGLLYGFITSFVVMLGGFYWVTYVIHVFGYLPWSISGILFLGFCCIGALNFPLFGLLATYLNRKIHFLSPNKSFFWFLVGMPALFALVEFLIPKLFPWYISHSFYRVLWLNQIVEFTGCTFLTFLIFMTGSAFALLYLSTGRTLRVWMKTLALPACLWLTCLGFSLFRMNQPEPPGKILRFALIQANIGSLEKVAARSGILDKVRYTMDRYQELSRTALPLKPDLLIWPETAMPFQLKPNGNIWAREIYARVAEWKTPLLTGGYAPGGAFGEKDYNAAFLLEPREDGQVTTQIYHKNILLAFGEYMPLGDVFPFLYEMFPAVSHFERGADQGWVKLRNETRLGVTICYEAIVPSFYRKVVAKNVNGILNLTNDSWFGPTSEPYEHGALSVFRAIETRIPLIRAANTGTSFTVDSKGRISRMTPVYEEDVLISDVSLPSNPPHTVYSRFGDWFMTLCSAMLLVGYLRSRKTYASVSH